MNGDDRWPDVLARRLYAAHGNRVSVVNAGIGGNQVVGPPEYGPERPFPGGPAAVQRLDRDVLSLSGVSTVVWLEGTNDFSRNGNASAEAVQAGMREAVGRMRARLPGVRVVGATVVSALNSTSPAHGFAEQDEKRKALNAFVRSSRALRRCGGLRRGDPRPGHGRAAARDGAGLDHRRAGRPAAPQPRGLPRHGRQRRPGRRGAAGPRQAPVTRPSRYRSAPATISASTFAQQAKECRAVKIHYKVVEHDGGWAYKLGDVFSEAFPDRAAALTAAKRAAAEQHVPGEAAYIEYQDEAGRWHTEFSAGDDRPDADVTG